MKRMAVATNPDLLSEYDQLTRGLSNIFYSQLLSTVNNLDNGSKADLRNGLIQAYPVLLSPFMETAATAGASFYEANRSLAVGGSYSALVARPSLSSLALEGLIRFAVSPLGLELGAMLVTKILSVAGDRMMRGAGNGSIALNVSTDDAAYGYARRPEPGACEFCAMLSMRVYNTESVALNVSGVWRRDRDATGPKKNRRMVNYQRANHNQPLGKEFHDNCKCETVPVFGTGGSMYEDIAAVNPKVSEYDALYSQAVDMSTDAGKGESTKAILANMRMLMNL